jgi:hypothetical protein
MQHIAVLEINQMNPRYNGYPTDVPWNLEISARPKHSLHNGRNGIIKAFRSPIPTYSNLGRTWRSYSQNHHRTPSRHQSQRSKPGRCQNRYQSSCSIASQSCHKNNGLKYEIEPDIPNPFLQPTLMFSVLGCRKRGLDTLEKLGTQGFI